jgi:ZIP family zinc transporter
VFSLYNVLFALGLTLLAGLATGLGGMVVLFKKLTDVKFLSVCLSFSAGVMLYVAFAEILKEAFDTISYEIATVSFFAGIILMTLVDKFIPHADEADEKELKRTGIMSAIAVSVHNFPEGLITFMAAVYDPAMGIAIAIAIIIHNIPEGISMAAPIYYSTGSKKKALFVSFGAGLTEPLGGIIAFLLLQNFLHSFDYVFGIAFAAVSGIMVFVAIHKLLPAAQKYGEHHLVMKWLFAGMAVMAASLILLEFIF